MDNDNDDDTTTPPTTSRLTIEDLSPDVLADILKWVDEPNLDNVQQVSPLWYSIIDECVGRAVTTYTRRSISGSNPSLAKVGLDLLPEIGIRKLFIGIRNGNLLEHPPEPLPSYKFPHLLKDFVLYGKIHPDLFTNLVEGTINLSMFIISLPALINLKPEDLERLNFPALANLRVKSLYGHDEALSLSNVKRLLESNRFPQLAHLRLDFHVERFQDLETMRLLLLFIQRHPVLKELTLSMTFPVTFTTVNRTSYQETLEGITGRMDNNWAQSLQLFRVEGKRMYGNYPHLDIWKELLPKSSSLQELKLKIGLLSNDLLQTVFSRNRRSLQEISLNQFRDPSIPQGHLDLGLFSILERLHTLELLGSQELTGARHLPPSLVYILLTGKMRSEDADHVLLRLPNLQKIVLVDFRNGEEGYGVRMESLRQFVEDRRVHRLVLDILDEEFPEERIPNGDPVNPAELTVSCHSHIHWKLNPAGYYVNGDRIIYEY